jgi:hypothetical protein
MITGRVSDVRDVADVAGVPVLRVMPNRRFDEFFRSRIVGGASSEPTRESGNGPPINARGGHHVQVC